MFGAKMPASGKRVPLIAGNWKMNKTTAEAATLSQKISFECDKAWEAVEVAIIPPFTDIKTVWNVLEFDHSSIRVGAQDVFWEEEGAYTGAISPLMLKELHCAFCIVGHSERREYFGETDETVNLKVKALLAHDITPIMCCGESLGVRDAGETLGFIENQVRNGLNDIPSEDLARIVVAYEPIWAIGTGRAATPEQAEEVCAHIRGVLADMGGEEAADKIRILYGGSMKPENAMHFLPCDNIDGGLIGGAALDAKAFSELVSMALQYK